MMESERQEVESKVKNHESEENRARTQLQELKQKN